jgi:hypothetical protein
MLVIGFGVAWLFDVSRQEKTKVETKWYHKFEWFCERILATGITFGGIAIMVLLLAEEISVYFV